LKRDALALGILLAVFTSAAFAHPAPNSVLRLDFAAHAVHAEYWVPISELEYARAADPAGEFPAYLLRHVAAETSAGRRWRIAVDGVRQQTYLDQPYLVATLTLVPPPGAPAREFVLVDDAVTHEVRNHRVYVVARRGATADVIGALQYPARRLLVAARAAP
jgi:hypothetical protein